MPTHLGTAAAPTVLRRLGVYDTGGLHIADYDLDALPPVTVWSEIHHYVQAGPVTLVLLPVERTAPPEFFGP